MIDVERPEMGLKDERRLDWLRAENERLSGLLDYTAMMADVELPGDEDEGEEDEL